MLHINSNNLLLRQQAGHPFLETSKQRSSQRHTNRRPAQSQATSSIPISSNSITTTSGGSSSSSRVQVAATLQLIICVRQGLVMALQQRTAMPQQHSLDSMAMQKHPLHRQHMLPLTHAAGNGSSSSRMMPLMGRPLAACKTPGRHSSAWRLLPKAAMAAAGRLAGPGLLAWVWVWLLLVLLVPAAAWQSQAWAVDQQQQQQQRKGWRAGFIPRKEVVKAAAAAARAVRPEAGPRPLAGQRVEQQQRQVGLLYAAQIQMGMTMALGVGMIGS